MQRQEPARQGLRISAGRRSWFFVFLIDSINRELMAELLKHLWQNGYQTVALLTDPQSASPVQKIRAEAFESLAAELG